MGIMVKTIELDSETMQLLKRIKLRPDESLTSVIGRLAVYCYDWEPLNEEFIKEMEERCKEPGIRIEDIDQYLIDSFCEDCDDECCIDECECCEIKGLCSDCEVEDDSPGAYVPFDPRIIPEVNHLMSETPADMPKNMTLEDFINSIPPIEDEPVVALPDNVVELFEGFHKGAPLTDVIRDQASYLPDREEILTYGSIHEIQRMLREDGIPVGSFKTVEQFNEHLKYLPKGKILF